MSYVPSSPVIFDFGGAAYVPASPLVFDFKPKISKTLLTMEVGLRHTHAKPSRAREIRVTWLPTVSNDLQENRLRWGRGTARDLARKTNWNTVPAKEIHARINWDNALGTDNGALSSWKDTPAKDISGALSWDHSIQARDTRLRIIYNPMPRPKEHSVQPSWGRVNEFGARFDAQAELKRSLYIPNTLPLMFAFGGQRYKSSGQLFFDFQYVPPVHAIQPVDSTAQRIRWGIAQRVNTNLRLRWGWGIPTDPRPTGITYPDYDGPVIDVPGEPDEPDLQDTYMIANTVSVCVMPNCTPIDVTNISIDLDIDSHSWSFSAALFGAASLQQVMPDALGQKTIKVTINGHDWLFVIESYSSAGKFPAERYIIRGASRTQLLAEPYAPKRSAVNAVSINARQAAEEQLLNTGFSIKWDSINNAPVDWAIPAGAFTYQEQTALQVISRIAESIGAVVRPSQASDELTILPRYRDAVWSWHTALIERIVPHQIVTDIAGEWSPQPTWNSCYVSGTTHGVAVDVRRAGTAGDKPAPDVFDDLITSESAARARGIAEICKGGNQEIVSLTLPLFPPEKAPGLVLPAMLCEVRPHNTTNWRGLNLATSISATGTGASKVTMTIKLERHHGNS